VVEFQASTFHGVKEVQQKVRVCETPFPVRIPRVVLTGGQRAGKSTILERVRSRMGKEVVCVTESATLVREDLGFKPHASDRERLLAFQRKLFVRQISRERDANISAVLGNANAVILDRGTLDGVPYLPGGIPEFEDLNNTSVDIQLSRYDAVLFIGQPDELEYEQLRAEGASHFALARQRHDALRCVWSRHTRYVHVDYEGIGKLDNAVLTVERVVSTLQRQSVTRVI
jgi:predicted ATPase